jgi:hypothetical protein
MGEGKKCYEKPAVIVEFDLETRAGTPPGGWTSNPLDNILLSESLGLDGPLN